MDASNRAGGAGDESDISALRTEFGGLRTELKGDVAELRTEMRAGFAGVNSRIDWVMDALVRHIQEGHPPHQAA